MKLLFGLFFCLLPLLAMPQEKCAFVPYNKQLTALAPALAPDPGFEKWMLQKQQALQQLRQQGRLLDARFVIPVVFHVIHRPGEAIGQGRNIPREQILNQLETLNRDFRAQNTAEIAKLPPQFQALAADTEIEFVLAKQDPEGLPTDGIVRIPSSETTWDQSEDLTLKGLSHWPSSNYVNIYSAALAGDVLGWAQFPQSDRLPGLNFSDVAEVTDGVVIDYRYLGTGFNAAEASKGRTLTHELGHYLGLLHIWGDGGCGVDDYVNDTPVDDGPHEGCPPATTLSSCTDLRPMWENFMDYTSDVCMALFTLGQKERMHVVLRYSPRRSDLNNSPGKQEPTIVPNDAGIRSLALNLNQLCQQVFVPVIEVRNYGNTVVTQLQVTLRVDGQAVRSYSINTNNLAYLDTQTLQLEAVEITQPGFHTITATVTLTNNQQDNKATNNTAIADIYVPQRTTLPISQTFEGGLEPFYVVNEDFSTTWEVVSTPAGTSATNKAAFMDFYNYFNIGARDILASPILNLGSTSTAYLSFRYAYALYPDEGADGLEVYVSTDCSNSLQTAQLIYQAYGEELATAPPTAAPFVPNGPAQWATLVLDFSAYAGLDNIQVLLVGVNDFGNNLYVDDIRLTTSFTATNNLAVTDILYPSPVFGNSTTPLQLEVLNAGTQPIGSATFQVTLDGAVIQTTTLNNLGLAPLETALLTLNPLEDLSEGLHKLRIDALSPNGQPDNNMADNRLTRYFIVDSDSTLVPFRETFTATTLSSPSIWTTVSPQQGLPGWEAVQVTGPLNGSQPNNYAVRAQFSTNWALESSKWLVTPILDMSAIWEAGMQFWYYAGGTGALSLRVLASADGGLSWPYELFQRQGTELRPNQAVAPPSASSWKKEFISLQRFVGQEGVRIAFVAEGQGSSVAYVDEIEFYLSDQPIDATLPERNQVSVFPNPAMAEFNLIFNMENPAGEDVVVELFDSRASLIFRKFFPTTLNQIYTLEVPELPSAVYFLHIRSTSLNTVKRVVLLR